MKVDVGPGRQCSVDDDSGMGILALKGHYSRHISLGNYMAEGFACEDTTRATPLSALASLLVRFCFPFRSTT